MKVTEAVLGEHCAIYPLLDHLEGAAAEAEEEGVLRAHTSVLAAVLESHARLEDELLLEPLLASTGASGGPPAAMVEEHGKIREMLGEAGGAEEVARARDLLVYAIRTARDHFEKEERMVFPMAERQLPPDRLEELGSRWLEDRGVRRF